MILSGQSPDGRLVEIVELQDHPWFVASQFHPEFKCRPGAAAPAVRRLRRGGARRAATGASRSSRARPTVEAPGRRAGEPAAAHPSPKPADRGAEHPRRRRRRHRRPVDPTPAARQEPDP